MNTQTTYTGYVEERSPLAGAVAAMKRAARRVAARMMSRHMERETVRELSSLPSHILKDIGLDRADIHAVASQMARTRADAWARQAGASNGFGG